MTDRKTPSIWRLTKLAASSHEDRLTEALALVLHSQALGTKFAHFLAEQAGVPRPSMGDFKVMPQRQLKESQDRVDLALESGPQRIWIEAKLDSPEGSEQLLTYASGLNDFYAHGPLEGEAILVFLTRQGGSEGTVERLREDSQFKKSGVTALAFDWRKVGEWIDQNGGLLGSSFAHYLKMEHVIVKPIATQGVDENPDLKALNEARRARKSWWQLFEGTRDRLRDSWELSTAVSSPKQKPWDECPMFNLNFAPRDLDSKWPFWRTDEEPHAWLELRLPDPGAALEFGCGLTLVDRGNSVAESFDLESLDVVERSMIGQPGELRELDFGEDGKLARIELVRPIEFLQVGSIEGQINELGEWANGVFRSIPLEAVRRLNPNS